VTRSALITGGTGGLGAAVTKRFLDDGWRVVVPWVNEHELSRVEEHERLEVVQADLMDASSVRGVIDAAGASLRAVVNLVGGFSEGGRVHETPIEEFEHQFQLNLRPTYLVTQAALPTLVAAGEGSVVCVGTRAALRPFPGAAGYIASKRAVLAFAEAVAVEYKDDGVRCNAILPSIIDTPGNRASNPGADFSKWVTGDQIAGVIAWLCSEDAKPTSGASIPVYGRA
jgi:NAD(P)-dependent dehydrogenase (short-subunit alcohol dehydrogenase family)